MADLLNGLHAYVPQLVKLLILLVPFLITGGCWLLLAPALTATTLNQLVSPAVMNMGLVAIGISLVAAMITVAALEWRARKAQVTDVPEAK